MVYVLNVKAGKYITHVYQNVEHHVEPIKLILKLTTDVYVLQDTT